MLHRIFIAINLPDDIRKDLLSWKERWQELPAKWAEGKNLHVTLCFLGSTSDKELEEVHKICKEVTEKHQPFSFSFKKIMYGPTEANPRMIWLVGERSEKLSILQEDLADALRNSPNLHPTPEERAFSPHITLARLREWALRRIDPEERPSVNEEVEYRVDVKSIEVMESKLKRSGPEHTILQTYPLGNTKLT